VHMKAFCLRDRDRCGLSGDDYPPGPRAQGVPLRPVPARSRR
jgi:hypothetical protein